MQKFAALSGFVSTNAGGDFHPGVRREPRFLTPSRHFRTNLRRAAAGISRFRQSSVGYVIFNRPCRIRVIQNVKTDGRKEVANKIMVILSLCISGRLSSFAETRHRFTIASLSPRL